MSEQTEIQFAELPEQLPEGAALLDVRNDDEWQAGHAAAATHIPLDQLADRLGEVPDGQPLYVVCRSGGRSSRATEYLNANGWQAVNVVGGMTAWEKAGRDLVSESGEAPRVL